MAWSDICRIHVMSHVEHKINSKKAKTLTEAFKQLSEESDIPVKTIESWYYEEKKRLEAEKGKSLDFQGIHVTTEDDEEIEETTSVGGAPKGNTNAQKYVEPEPEPDLEMIKIATSRKAWKSILTRLKSLNKHLVDEREALRDGIVRAQYIADSKHELRVLTTFIQGEE